MIKMKNNQAFDKFIELKKKFEENPTKAQKEEVVKEVEYLITHVTLIKIISISPPLDKPY